METLDAFTRAYLETALWAETDDDGQPLDSRYTLADFAPEALAAAVADCARFQELNAADIAGGRHMRRSDSRGTTTAGLAGHDFWLTRNRHGAGFWDGDWPDGAGERMTASAHSFGERYPYRGDDGRLYLA